MQKTTFGELRPLLKNGKIEIDKQNSKHFFTPLYTGLVRDLDGRFDREKVVSVEAKRQLDYRVILESFEPRYTNQNLKDAINPLQVVESSSEVSPEFKQNSDKIWKEMYYAAKSVINERRISEYVSCGEVAAAICSKSGKIYTGVCIDTACTLGICAERNAIFNMITNGENEIARVLCVMPDGSNGAPCGACRELMVQMMPGNYKDIEIMLDYATKRTIKLGEIKPEWWIK